MYHWIAHPGEWPADIARVTSVAWGMEDVRISPDPVLVATVQAVVSDVAGRADFDLDAIADLRMALDEACAALITLADPNTLLCCRLTLERNFIEVLVSARAARVDTSGFGWRVLSTLVDELRTDPVMRTLETAHPTIGLSWPSGW